MQYNYYCWVSKLKQFGPHRREWFSALRSWFDSRVKRGTFLSGVCMVSPCLLQGLRFPLGARVSQTTKSMYDRFVHIGAMNVCSWKKAKKQLSLLWFLFSSLLVKWNIHSCALMLFSPSFTHSSILTLLDWLSLGEKLRHLFICQINMNWQQLLLCNHHFR